MLYIIHNINFILSWYKYITKRSFIFNMGNLGTSKDIFQGHSRKKANDLEKRMGLEMKEEKKKI